MTITIEVTSRSAPKVSTTMTAPGHPSHASRAKKKGLISKNGREPALNTKTVEATFVQDVTGLRSRVGDTGSVIWRVRYTLFVVLHQVYPASTPSLCCMLTLLLPSVNFAHEFLTDILFPSSGQSIISKPILSTSNVLELGSGTGVLSVLLGPHTRRWIATDLPELVPLIDKNIKMNQNDNSGSSPKKKKQTSSQPGVSIVANELDWLSIADTDARSRARARARQHIQLPPLLAQIPAYKASPSSQHHSDAHAMVIQEPSTSTQPHFHLILAVDTLYNTSLVPSFVAVLDEFALPPYLPQLDVSPTDPTLVLVVSELRDEEVLRSFLVSWLALDGWEIWRVGNALSFFEKDITTTGENSENEDATRINMLDGPFVVWAGWKVDEKTV